MSNAVTSVERAVYSVRELAELLGLAENSVYEYLDNGRIPARKIGKKWIIGREKIHQWLMESPCTPITRR
jgi:excisionase family DNA binding protein